jgi:hypothetical protein
MPSRVPCWRPARTSTASSAQASRHSTARGGVWVSYPTGMMGAVELLRASGLSSAAVFSRPSEQGPLRNRVTATVSGGDLWVIDAGGTSRAPTPRRVDCSPPVRSRSPQSTATARPSPPPHRPGLPCSRSMPPAGAGSRSRARGRRAPPG